MTFDGMQTDQTALLAELQVAGAQIVKPDKIRCPFHDDKNPSSGIYKDEAGMWRFKCHAADCGFHGDMYDVRAKVQGKTVEEVLKAVRSETQAPAAAPKPPSPAVREYDSLGALAASFGSRESVHVYANPDTGNHDLVAVRYIVDGKKTFSQAHQDGDKYLMCAPALPMPLYNRTRLRSADTVIVVEGEKCVHALHPLEFVATTSPGGAGKAARADWTPLDGKTVYLWPDNDDGGRKHMDDVADILKRGAKEVLLVDIGELGLPEKGDVVDYLASLGEDRPEAQRIAVEAVLQDAQWVKGEGIRGRLEQIIRGELDTLPLPWGALMYWSEMLCAGTVSVMCGGEGDRKSFLVQQLMSFLQADGWMIAVYELEEGVEFYLHRLLAQLDQNSRLANIRWCKANGDEALAANSRWASQLNAYRAAIEDAEDQLVTYDQILEWIEAKAKAGVDVIAIDPITAVEVNREPWIADHKFIMAAKTLMRKYKSRLILVTHPRTGHTGEMTLDKMAGGAAYRRFPQTVWWVKKFDEPEELTVKSRASGEVLTEEVVANAKVQISKARNGPGQGLGVAMNFRGDSLLFDELGVIIKKP